MINRLPPKPTIEDLKKYSKIRLKKKRSIKKFNKNPLRYVSDEIAKEYMLKRLCAPLLRSLNYAELGKKLFHVEELPKGEWIEYDIKR